MVQALNYATMARGFSLDLLAEAYGARRGGELCAAELQEELHDCVPALSDEALGPARIVLVAEDFGPVLRNTAMFLIARRGRSPGLDPDRLVAAGIFEESKLRFVVPAGSQRTGTQSPPGSPRTRRRRSGAGDPAVELERDDQNVLAEDLRVGDHPLLKMLPLSSPASVRLTCSAGVALAPSTV